MSPELFLKGLIIGFSIAAPVGPIGVLCIRRTLAEGCFIGFSTGLGAASADAVYGCIAAFGVTAISTFLVGQRFWLGILGGIFLCYLGVRTFRARPPGLENAVGTSGALLAYLSAFGLTVTNPATILSFAAVFAGVGLAQNADYGGAAILVSGVFLGSAVWWFILTEGVGFFRSSLGAGWLRWINRLSGTVIFAFGLYSLLAQLL